MTNDLKKDIKELAESILKNPILYEDDTFNCHDCYYCQYCDAIAKNPEDIIHEFNCPTTIAKNVLKQIEEI